MDWASSLTLFTPVSIALLITYLALLVLLTMLAIAHRAAIATWFLTRLQESNSQDAINTALTATALCLTGAAPIASVVPLWAACAGLFIKPEGKKSNPSIGVSAPQVSPTIHPV